MPDHTDGFDAVLFDVDDTLYDRRAAQGDILRHMIRRWPELFADRDEAAVFAAFDQSDRDTVDHFYTSSDIRASRTVRTRRFLEALGRPDDRAAELTDLYVEAYREVNRPVPDAAVVLTACARDHSVGVISNAFPDVQYHKLTTIGVRHLLHCIVLSEEVGIRKPDPAIFELACADLNVEPERALYVGDSFANDVVGAHAAGLASCWFNPGGGSPPQADPEPDFTVSRLLEVVALVGADQPA